LGGFHDISSCDSVLKGKQMEEEGILAAVFICALKHKHAYLRSSAFICG
jgi:hypothetical protein